MDNFSVPEADLYLEGCPGDDHNLAASGEFLITWLAELYLKDIPGKDQTWQLWRVSDYLARSHL